jgi:hypothetical protein
MGGTRHCANQPILRGEALSLLADREIQEPGALSGSTSLVVDPRPMRTKYSS